MTTDYQIKIMKRTGANATLEINGKERVFEWERLKKTETAVKTSKSASSGPRVAGGVYPPMPGKITEVRVKVGDTVKSGSTLCILEAMKMFNELKTNISGTVKEVNVEVGSMVSTSDLLVLVE
ncbi:biotin/lipoyl-binding protein [Candidatus Thorarchaeota archaeon]|nr:MAG: biotin/lipoyl-binding protein [Candidatus Thorarchaeota archaeon]